MPHVAVPVRRPELVDHAPVRRLLRVSAAAEVMNNPPALVARPIALRDTANHHRHARSLQFFSAKHCWHLFFCALLGGWYRTQYEGGTVMSRPPKTLHFQFKGMSLSISLDDFQRQGDLYQYRGESGVLPALLASPAKARPLRAYTYGRS